MLRLSWLRLRGRAAGPTRAEQRPRETASPARLRVEPLEDRCVPSSGYQQINLTGYQPGMGRFTDPHLNGWGMDHTPDGPFAVANTSTGTITFYDAHGRPLPTVVSVPAAPGQPVFPVGSPTGLVYNPTSDFVISAHGKSAPATFLFDTLDGLVCGWNPAVDPTHAIVVVDNSAEAPFPASYTGLAIGHDRHGHNVIYAADSGGGPDISNDRIDTFDGRFHPRGSFTDPAVATQYPGNTVFQVENEDGKLFVTFAGFAPPFGGVVDVFDTDGHLLTPSHFAANAPGAGPLVNPWGIVQAPSNFGPFSNDLLIGNVEGDGNINAFDPHSGRCLGPLTHPDGTPIAITGLWDLAFGGGMPANGRTNDLYFNAGFTAADPAGNGLFGLIRVAEDTGDHLARHVSEGEPARALFLLDPMPGVSDQEPAQPAGYSGSTQGSENRIQASDRVTSPAPPGAGHGADVRTGPTLHRDRRSPDGREPNAGSGCQDPLTRDEPFPGPTVSDR
jgi:uncharacterized protein (TIGR03118 family)